MSENRILDSNSHLLPHGPHQPAGKNVFIAGEKRQFVVHGRCDDDAVKGIALRQIQIHSQRGNFGSDRQKRVIPLDGPQIFFGRNREFDAAFFGRHCNFQQRDVREHRLACLEGSQQLTRRRPKACISPAAQITAWVSNKALKAETPS